MGDSVVSTGEADTGARPAAGYADRLRAVLLAQDGVARVEITGDRPLSVRIDVAERIREDALARHLDDVDQVFGMMVETSEADHDTSLDTSVWVSGITRQPMDTEVMREWVDATVAAITELRPRRVLEIGCGTGLLLSRIAPDCDRYVGTDISDRVLARLLANLDRTGGRPNGLHTLRRPAHDLSGIDGPFDVVVVNSVVQYFPSVPYLWSVLDSAWDLLAPDGVLFVGDVRSQPLLTAYHAESVLATAPRAPAAQVLAHARRRAAQDPELVISPELFSRWADRHPDAAGVDARLKRGGDNELTRYRYDVFLPRSTATLPFVQELPWAELQDAEERWPALVGDRSVSLVLDVPNPRLSGLPPQAVAAVGGAAGRARADRAAGFVDGLRAAGGTVHLRWPRSQRPGLLDVVVGGPGTTPRDLLRPSRLRSDAELSQLASDPVLSRLTATLERRWHKAVLGALPEPHPHLDYDIRS
ncbi:class I SAM-dependent methyltransferase [Solihabitans fulvus]|nr:class I SAM-dependent methyltransferase [Solihabitans fulvus]